jgi:hypothetical protein
MRSARWILGAALGLLPARPLPALGDPPPVPAPAPAPAPTPSPAPAPTASEEVELEGEAKKKHEQEVKETLAMLRTEKNRETVAGRIERIGAQGTRAGRDALMAFAVGNKNQEYLEKTFRALAKIGGNKAIDFLCGKNALRSGDFLVQQSAAEALATAKSPRAVGPLLDVLTDKATKIEVVGAAAKAVAQSAPRDERVTETLFKLTEHVKDTIRAYAVEALGYLATDDATARLVDVLVNDKNTRVRGGAATGLGNSGRRDVIPHLEKAFEAEQAFTVKDKIQQALKTLERSSG